MKTRKSITTTVADLCRKEYVDEFSRATHHSAADRMRHLYWSLLSPPSAGDIAEATGLSRSVVYRALIGETRNPQGETTDLITAHLSGISDPYRSDYDQLQPIVDRIRQDIKNLVPRLGKDETISIATAAAQEGELEFMAPIDKALQEMAGGAAPGTPEYWENLRIATKDVDPTVVAQREVLEDPHNKLTDQDRERIAEETKIFKWQSSEINDLLKLTDWNVSMAIEHLRAGEYQLHLHLVKQTRPGSRREAAAKKDLSDFLLQNEQHPSDWKQPHDANELGNRQ